MIRQVDGCPPVATGFSRLTLKAGAMAVLKYYSNSAMTNTSLRERLKMPEKQRSMVSVLIQEALDRKLVKPADLANKSKKFAEYVPIWA